jgi:hemerythrin superfamily protein
VESLSEEWVKNNIQDPTNELVVLNKIIPWQKIINKLVCYYNAKKGPIGISLRTVIALFIVSKLSVFSDRRVICEVKENRYIQYFCNVPDEYLAFFMHHSNLSKLRKRFGVEGMEVIESVIFNLLRIAGVIKNDAMLIDSSVLSNNIIYPTDIGLVFKAFEKMKQFAQKSQIPVWWDDQEIKQLWREYNLNRKNTEINEIFFEFIMILSDALGKFEKILQNLKSCEREEEKAQRLLDLLTLLQHQNEQKLAGKKHIPDRIVSLDEPDARPIVKGKKHPKCEFGSTLELSFNRQGFMVTMENFIGKPNDTTLWERTTELFQEKMKGIPEYAIGDQGYRSQTNQKIPKGASQIFLGKTQDVEEKEQKYCQKARSATEGFIAVAKNLRGFGLSLYRGIDGDRIWSLLCQTAYNLKKFIQLYKNEEISEQSLMKLGLLG